MLACALPHVFLISGIDEKKDTAGGPRHKEYAEEFGSLLSTAFKVEAKVDSFNEDDPKSIIRTVEESAKEVRNIPICFIFLMKSENSITLQVFEVNNVH